MYVTVKDLPPVVRETLDKVNYGRADIEVIAAESVQLSDAGAGNGRQAFVALVNLADSTWQVHRGSWGGQNMFDRSNPVDNDDRSYVLPAEGVAIKGVRGGTTPVWARLYVSSAMQSRILPAAPTELSDQERDALYCYKAVRAGAYRADELRRRKVPASAIDAMVARGFLKRNRAGATAITTDGKNALGSYRGY